MLKKSRNSVAESIAFGLCCHAIVRKDGIGIVKHLMRALVFLKRAVGKGQFDATLALGQLLIDAKVIEYDVLWPPSTFGFMFTKNTSSLVATAESVLAASTLETV